MPKGLSERFGHWCVSAEAFGQYCGSLHCKKAIEKSEL
jgi:hypothetical protein